MSERFQDAGVATKPMLTEFQFADDYRPGERIVSKFTRRTGVVAPWPGLPVIGAVWVRWDDGLTCHAWRHQINRI